MFKRILYENWTGIVPVASFCLTFGVFLIIGLRALLFKKSFVKRMGHMPLEDNEQPKPLNHE